MSHYLLAVHTSDDPPSDHEPSPEERHAGFRALVEVEDEMQVTGTWVFSGGLTGPDDAMVLRRDSGRLVTTDGPFAESKEHIAGFYVIEAADLDEALGWADRVTSCLGVPIEVRPFAATGDLRSQMGPDA